MTSKVADVGWKFTEVATRKVSEVSETVTEKVNFALLTYLHKHLVHKVKALCFAYVFTSFFFVGVRKSQHTERDLNKIEKTFNKTFSGLKSMHQGFRICFV